MEQNKNHEQNQNNLNGEQFQYHQRISSYDPNMCSTAARLSPPYQPQDEQIILSNTHHQPISSSFSKSASSRNQQTYTTDYHHPTSYPNFYPTTITNSTETEQLIFHRSPNGHTYQDYYNPQVPTNNSEVIQYVQTTQINGNTEIYEQPYSNAVNSVGEQEIQSSVYQFVPTANDYQADADEAYLENEVILTLDEKNRQRTLLESTMSPLLAAVDDITQRELEAAEFLYQNFENNLYNKSAYYPDEEEEISQPSSFNNNMKKLKKKKNAKPEDITEIGSGDDGEMIEYLVISDDPVETRAKASLPSKYLTFSKTNKEPIICAKREIPKMTKFGPIEGDLRFVSDVILEMLRLQVPKTHPLLIIGKTRMVDISNENNSNWMRYIKLAKNFDEQNLLLYEENEKLYFKCSRIIHPKEELCVGYSSQYANEYNLEILYLNTPLQIISHTASWHNNIYTDCDENFSNDDTKNYENDSAIINNNENHNKKIIKNKKRRTPRTKKTNNHNLYKINSSRCYVCNKAFMTNFSLRKHVKTHLDEKKKQKLNTSGTKLKEKEKSFNCKQCQRNFLTSVALKIHENSHNKDRYFSCILCSKKYKKIMEFRQHIKTHSINDLYYCNFCKKKYLDYHLVRKHIKIFHLSSRKYQCNECGRKFLDQNFLKRHKVVHSDQYNFHCNKCVKKFKRKDKLKEHTDKVHSIENELKKLRREEKKKEVELKKLEKKKYKKSQIEINDGSQYLKISPKKNKRNKKNDNHNKKYVMKIDLNNFLYKCNECNLGFKRRGMLVNHINKFHPNLSIEDIKELNEPIIKSKMSFGCLFCPKVYASNNKRKLHILKYHPDQEVPVKNNIGVRKIGNITDIIHQCTMCYKQYSSKAKLFAHHRKHHSNENSKNTNNDIEDNFEKQIIMEQQQPSEIFFRSQQLSENKLLQLSSAALDFL